jgi:tryptophan halogenase
MNFEYETIRDFLVMHYHLTERTDTPYWDYLREMKVADYLADKLAIFRDHGRIFRENDELFADTSWFAVMIGQGLWPDAHDSLVDVMPEAELKRRMEGIRQVIRKSVDWMPQHHDFIREHCAADPVQFRRSAGVAGSATAVAVQR